MLVALLLIKTLFRLIIGSTVSFYISRTLEFPKDLITTAFMVTPVCFPAARRVKPTFRSTGDVPVLSGIDQ
jgi:hypothetical protein